MIGMSKFIYIGGVPDDIERRLTEIAAQSDMSLSDFLLKQICRIATKPTLQEMAERLKNYPVVQTSESPAEVIRAMREDR
jgi:hypothetical protein